MFCLSLPYDAATSQLLLQMPQVDEQLPMAADGGILDIHVTAFLSAIDSLLTAGRSNSPTRVLTPMKSVVNAVTAIIDDVQAFENRPSRDRSDVDTGALRSLRERANATLTNLAAAAKTHATSAGMSPVSLLDAAASHVSVTITQLGKTVCIRAATNAEKEQSASMFGGTAATATNGFSSSASASEVTTLSRNASRSSSNVDTNSNSTAFRTIQSSVSSPSTSRGSKSSSSRLRRPPFSDRSSSEASSPPPVFEKALVTANENPVQTTDNAEDAWLELKVWSASLDAPFYSSQLLFSLISRPRPSPSCTRYKACCPEFAVRLPLQH